MANVGALRLRLRRRLTRALGHISSALAFAHVHAIHNCQIMEIYFKALRRKYLESSTRINTRITNYSARVPSLDQDEWSEFRSLLLRYPDDPVGELFTECEMSSPHFPWEGIYEMVRQDGFPDLPSRLESYFVFNDLVDAEKWATRNPEFVTCELHVVECWNSFTGDMNNLDCVEIDASFREIERSVRSYWSEDYTFNPTEETLMQGIFEIKPAIK
jgi:hypothetical protein